MKTCSKCKIEKPFEAFYEDKTRRDGYKLNCKECIKQRRLKLKKNPLMQLEKQIRSSIVLENKLLKIENKKLCVGCREVFLIDELTSGIICKECSREKSKEYYKESKEKCKEYRRKYYEKNKDIICENVREYREKNKEKIKEHKREYQREYRLKKKLEKLQNNDTQT